MRLKHHRFRFGLIGNLKVLLCRIFGHRVSDDPTGFACQRCRLAYEEIYSPGYWKAMIEWMKPKPENVETKELVSALVDELMKHTRFPGTEHQVDLFERCAPYLDIPEMPESLNHPPIFPQRETILDDSEMIGEETQRRVNEILNTQGMSPDEYLARLVKEASPSWQGVDPQKFMDEVRGRNAELEWKKGAPPEDGWYIWVDKYYYTKTLGYWDPEAYRPSAILFHIGPIPPVPQNDEK